MTGDRDAASESIRREARCLGFSSVGFAPAEPPAHADAYLRWLRDGMHADMAWMAREDAVRRRVDPGQALDRCRTVIMVTLSYAPPDARRERPDPRSFAAAPDTDPGRDRHDGVIARYALGRDYHDVFEERLEALVRHIDSLDPDARCRTWVDYGPVLERDHAQRAGLGWIGKNTLLIDPGLGSYLLLGEIFTTLDLVPDPPFLPDRCGTCTRCIEACPTGAITAPRVLDSRLCISWLTIENRGPIPEELRAKVGNRVFGCDICQETCPWNRQPAPGAVAALDLGRPVAPARLVDWAEELLALDAGGFDARYQGTALRRPGRDALLRNVCVGLGNTADPAVRPLLEECAGDGSALVREHARWALSRV